MWEYTGKEGEKMEKNEEIFTVPRGKISFFENGAKNFIFWANIQPCLGEGTPYRSPPPPMLPSAGTKTAAACLN